MKFGDYEAFVIVAHRLSTVKNADQIVVINQGKVVEVGNADDFTMLFVNFKKLDNGVVKNTKLPTIR